MKIETIVHLDQFCEIHQIEISFMEELASFELINLIDDSQKKCIMIDDVPLIEKMIRIHQDLEITPAGINAIFHLLEKLNKKQDEIIRLKTRINLFD
jgi:hypothetical protein